MSNLQIAIIGPSGSGKTTIVQQILLKLPNVELSISYTTRAPRHGETNGLEYNFISKEQFQQLQKHSFFLETEEIYGNYYGTPVGSPNKNVIFNVGYEGIINLQQHYPDLIVFFISPPSLDILERRLKNRSDTCVQRIESIKTQLEEYQICNYFIINNDIAQAVREILEIINIHIKNAQNRLLIKNMIAQA